MNSSSVLLFLLLTVSVAGLFSMPSVFAEEEQTVRIPVGAASPSCADDDSCYVPSKININEGYEVKWINDDSTVHTVTSGTPSSGHDGFFNSGMIRAHEEFEFTFNGFENGTYPYYCIAHPWMVGSVTVVDGPVDVMDDDSSDITKYDSDNSLDDVYERDSDKTISKESPAKPTLLENQRMFGKYKVTVDWIKDLPAVNEINGIEILVSDTTKKSSHGDDKGKHGKSKGKQGSSGGCGGGEDHGDDKESHGDSMKGKSGHDDKGKKDHEGGCPHFKMVKKMIPSIELLENGVSLVDRSMKIKMSLGNSELTMPIVADENLPGRYTAVFVPTVAGKYGVEVYGMIHGSPVSMMVEMDRVFDKKQVIQFP